MKIAIFGASGGTGKLLTARALAAGHTVSALVRHPATYPFTGKVRVVQGDAFSPLAVAETLTGADAVLSALGARSLKREDVLERAVPLILQQMLAAGVSRIIVLGSSGALPSALDHQSALRRWIIENILYKTLLKWPVASQRAQYAALAQSPLDWTMIMPPMLTDGPGRGTWRIDPDALPRNGSRIARADVADLMFQQLTDRQWSRRAVYQTW